MKRAKLVAARYNNGWSQEEAAEKIGVTRNTLGQWERGKAAPYPLHIHKLCELYGRTVEELDLKERQAEVADVTHENVQSESNSKPYHLSQGVPQATLLMSREAGSQDVDIPRRQVLHGILATACTTLILSPYALLHPDGSARLARTVIKHFSIDPTVLRDLEAITQRYWNLSKNTAFDLFAGVMGHFQTVIQLLKRPQPGHISHRLYSLVGEVAQILGKLLFDIHEYPLAWSYYAIALQAAQIAKNNDLLAVGLGRMSLLSICNNQPYEALTLLAQSQNMAIQDNRVRAWLAAVKAEAHAHRDEVDACREALDTSELITSEQPFQEDIYATGFNQSRLLGYKGACFTQLGKSEPALSSLQAAFTLLDPLAIRRQSMILVDMAIVYAQQGDVTGAYTYACQALEITIQTHSFPVLQRIQS